MRRFRLIKKYPGSFNLLIEVEKGEDGFYWYGADKFRSEEIEKFPEFWEEIQQKEYEILLVEYPSGIREKPLPHNVGKLVKKCKILSIKRTSDGEIFTLGDQVYNKVSEGRGLFWTLDRIELTSKSELLLGRDKYHIFPLSDLLMKVEKKEVRNLNHQKILDRIEAYLSRPGAEHLRFWQALYNMNIIKQELAPKPNTELWETPEMLPRIVDDHNISDESLLKRING